MKRWQLSVKEITSIYVDRDSKFLTTRHQSIHVNLKGDYKETQMRRERCFS